MLYTIATNSYQTTCTVSERTFNKRQHANARHGVDFSLFTHYDIYIPQSSWTTYQQFFLIFGGHTSFYGATDTPILDF